MNSGGEQAVARNLQYARNVGDVTSGSASATIFCTEKIGETGVLFVGCSHVPESCSLPRVCEQGVKMLTLRLTTAFETCESAVARVKLKKIRCSCRQCPETPVSYAATSHCTTPVLPPLIWNRRGQAEGPLPCVLKALSRWRLCKRTSGDVREAICFGYKRKAPQSEESKG